MDWLSLEGIPRVRASYRVWKRCRKTLRASRKNSEDKFTLRVLKSDLIYEFDELVDAILSLTDADFQSLIYSLKQNKLFYIMSSVQF